MACLLIDYENEGSRIEGLSFLNFTERDEIVVFYTRHADHFSINLHRELETMSAKKRYIEAETGKANALDFQLVSYLGFRINQNPFDNYFIVSKDTGFEPVCAFWRKQKVAVRRIEKISHYALLGKDRI